MFAYTVPINRSQVSRCPVSNIYLLINLSEIKLSLTALRKGQKFAALIHPLGLAKSRRKYTPSYGELRLVSLHSTTTVKPCRHR
ncbi:hypothetical protein VCR3J2_310251 [Vibrio coralliirubri]|nr:hypothetical protein VCR3J2_310251 [Vibrio coralliirubri]